MLRSSQRELECCEAPAQSAGAGASKGSKLGKVRGKININMSEALCLCIKPQL